MNPSTNRPINHPYLTFVLVMLVGQLSPGPDFLLVVKNSLNHGLRTGLLTVAGISTGIVFHATAAAAGLAVLLSVSPRLFRVLLVAGALYLGWLGIKLLLSLGKTGSHSTSDPQATSPRGVSAYREGLLTNLLNPKVLVFFSSMLSQFIRPDSPSDRILFPAIIIIEGAIVWSLLAFVLQKAPVRRLFLRFQRPLNSLFGVLLLLLAAATLLRS